MARMTYLEKLRHTAAHLLAAAVLKLYPQAKIAIGPPIENGFYYDIDFGETKISEADLQKLEVEMRKIILSWKKIEGKKVSEKEARTLFADNPYKLELIDEIVHRKEKITVYQSGDFIDLCRGGHVDQPCKEVKHFKLLKIAGAYWRGDKNNKMLTRIYGTAFASKKELEHYLWQIEEAKKRDHRKLGKDLGLFLIPEEIGTGLIIWTPKGATIRRIIEDFILKEQTKRGYLHAYTPHLGKKSLWQISGHWDLYREKMYSPMKIDDEEYLIKPMSCPMHMMIYRSKPRSYRDLPLRIAETATVYRYEQTGELTGILRVRHITQDDAHIFCREDQVVEEFLSVFNYLKYLLKIFKIDDYYSRLGLRSKHEKYLGSDDLWKKAEFEIVKALKKENVPYITSEGDAAFYGPKLDVIIKDSLGRKWQAGTIQIDFMLPERFNLEYIDRDNKKKRPVVIHRAPLGSLERFIGLLIEHYAGAFPVWLSPVQIAILPISERFTSLARATNAYLVSKKIRSVVIDDGGTLQKKIRQATLQKIPYMIIIGAKEAETIKNEVPEIISLRTREGKDFGQVKFYEFVDRLISQIESFL
ncbi:MAG: threonine--tRNA ligase [Patescibacteria group bacterium]|nr:threonine--tRNA ligase [Patescibacteria group bacterium]